MSTQPTQLPPLALYVHIPWCIRKCPYCDFNSHEVKEEIPVKAYIEALKTDLENDRHMSQGRRFESIFFGGGTPSLMPASAIGEIIQAANNIVGIHTHAEITLEANPGTVEHHDFAELRGTGVNRLSVGVQSFDAKQLKTLGRIHSPDEVYRAVERAKSGGFDNFNLDLMHGLPGQSTKQALSDITQAISLQPQHISWYQLTIEQNTEFFSRPPTLPHEDTLHDIMEEGMQLLANHGYQQYEVSAYAKSGKQSQHNLNYWKFGDYMAIGAGAHGKITTGAAQCFRYRKTRLPKDYLNNSRPFTAHQENVGSENLPLEFMMNALRLNAGVEREIFIQRTGLALKSIETPLADLQRKGLIEPSSTHITPTKLGRLFLNTVLEAFS